LIVSVLCGVPVEDVAGHGVESVGDEVEGGLLFRDGGSFGEPASEKPVGVLHEGFLPRGPGGAEEHVSAGVVLDTFPAGEFTALVPRQCFTQRSREAFKELGDNVGDVEAVTALREGTEETEPALAFTDHYRSGVVAGADDQVTFEVSRFGGGVSGPVPNTAVVA
jgi:hypothetical protein